MLRRLTTRRWILTHLGVLLAVVACVSLGLWQLRRLEDRRALNAAVTAGLSAPPAPLDQVLAADDPGYRRASVRGAYDPGRTYTLIGRTFEGRTGSHLLTPLYPEGGGPALIVDRGWVPEGSSEEGAPPEGAVEVEGVLIPSANGGTIGEGRTVVRVDTELLGSDLGRSVIPLYLQLRSQQPPQSDALPRPAPLPALDEGPHLSYAVQWFLFAAVAIGGWVVLVRRELRQPAGGGSSSGGGGGGMPLGQTQGSRE